MFIYMIQGAMMTGQSIMAGPMGKTLKAHLLRIHQLN